VLQGYNGALTMLDGRSGGGTESGQGMGMREGGQSSYDRGPSSGSRGGNQPAESFDQDLDDEIPF